MAASSVFRSLKLENPGVTPGEETDEELRANFFSSLYGSSDIVRRLKHRPFFAKGQMTKTEDSNIFIWKFTKNPWYISLGNYNLGPLLLYFCYIYRHFSFYLSRDRHANDITQLLQKMDNLVSKLRTNLRADLTRNQTMTHYNLLIVMGKILDELVWNISFCYSNGFRVDLKHVINNVLGFEKDISRILSKRDLSFDQLLTYPMKHIVQRLRLLYHTNVHGMRTVAPCHTILMFNEERVYLSPDRKSIRGISVEKYFENEKNYTFLISGSEEMPELKVEEFGRKFIYSQNDNFLIKRVVQAIPATKIPSDGLYGHEVAESYFAFLESLCSSTLSISNCLDSHHLEVFLNQSMLFKATFWRRRQETNVLGTYVPLQRAEVLCILQYIDIVAVIWEHIAKSRKSSTLPRYMADFDKILNGFNLTELHSIVPYSGPKFFASITRTVSRIFSLPSVTPLLNQLPANILLVTSKILPYMTCNFKRLEFIQESQHVAQYQLSFSPLVIHDVSYDADYQTQCRWTKIISKVFTDEEARLGGNGECTICTETLDELNLCLFLCKHTVCISCFKKPISICDVCGQQITEVIRGSAIRELMGEDVDKET